MSLSFLERHMAAHARMTIAIATGMKKKMLLKLIEVMLNPPPEA